MLKAIFLVSVFFIYQSAMASEAAPVLDKQIGEFLVPGEAEATSKLVELFSTHMKSQYEEKHRMALRAVHAKSHGCLNGEFEVFNHGDRDLQYGVFKEPKRYPAFIRYSNGDGPPGRDTDKTISIGMAIKLLGVNQEKLLSSQDENVQDFLMINQAAFLVKDIVDFAELIKAREGGFLEKGSFAARFPKALAFRSEASPKDDPLNTFFWSALPFRLGNTAVKYLARPCRVKPKSKKWRSADFLSELVKNHIEREPACFNFFLQKRLLNGRQEEEMPIENARVIWDEKQSVPVLVGQLRIAKQTLVSPSLCERSEFSPWNTTDDFSPLGNLNRIRKTVYDLSSSERHRINHSQDPFRH